MSILSSWVYESWRKYVAFVCKHCLPISDFCSCLQSPFSPVSNTTIQQPEGLYIAWKGSLIFHRYKSYFDDLRITRRICTVRNQSSKKTMHADMVSTVCIRQSDEEFLLVAVKDQFQISHANRFNSNSPFCLFDYFLDGILNQRSSDPPAETKCRRLFQFRKPINRKLHSQREIDK